MNCCCLYRLLYHRHPRKSHRCRMLLLPGPHYQNQYLLNFHYQKYFLPGSRPECFQRHHSHLLYPDFPHCQIRYFLCWNYLRQNHLREIYPHHHFFLHQKLPALLLLLFRSQPVSFFLHHQLVPDLFLELLLLSQFLKDQFPVLFLFRSCCCYRCYGCRCFLSFQMQSYKISGCRYRKCIRQYLPCLLLFLLLRLYKGRSVFLLRSVRRSLDLHQD